MAEINKIKGVVVGQYGEAITLTVVDKNGNAVDISTYSTALIVYLRDPQTLKTLTYAATFVTDGVNGKLRFTPTSGDIDREGTWEGQIRLEKASSISYTKVFKIEVEKRIGGS